MSCSSPGSGCPRSGSGPSAPRTRALFAHGITASKETMFRFAEALARQGVDCVSVDFPGHGESRHAFGRWEDAEASLVAGERALGSADVVVGFSMGAGVAARCIAKRVAPRRFVALGATPPGADLYLIGAWDELVTPPEGAVVSSWSDHALAPSTGRGRAPGRPWRASSRRSWPPRSRSRGRPARAP